MASEKDSCQSCCADDPNFAIICSFLERFATSCGVSYPTFSELQEMIESPQDAVPHELMELHVKLLRKIRKSVSAEKWEKALIKFCHSYYCNEEGWELERCGYKKCKVSVKLRILKTLCDAQFDLNAKLKTDVNKLTAEELRLEPLGKDKVGQAYWCQFDPAANVRVYKEDQDEETWKLVAKDRESLVELVTQLSSGEELLELELINEDSNSQEIEKPITDTGQLERSTSEENSTDNISCILKTENVTKQEEINESVSQREHSSEPCSMKPEQNAMIDETNNSAPKDSILETNLPHKSEKKLLSNVNEIESKSMLVNSLSDKIIDKSIEKEDILPETKGEEAKPLNQSKNQSSVLVNHIIDSESSKDAVSTENGLSFNLSSDLLHNKNSNNIEESKPTTNLSSEDPIVKPSIDISSSLVSADESKRIENKGNDSEVRGEKMDKENIILLAERKRKLDESVDNSSKKHCREDNKKVVKQEIEDNDKNQEITCDPENECGSLREETEVGKEIEEPVKVFQGEGLGNDCDTENPEFSNQVGEEIKEPVMIFRGEGSGKDCDTGNPEFEGDVGEEIVEPFMIWYGEGSGRDCDTGNPEFDNEVGEEIEEPVVIFYGEGSGRDCDTGNPGLEHDEGVKNKDDANNDSKDTKDLVDSNTNSASFKSETSSFDNSVHRLKAALHDSENKIIKPQSLPSDNDNEDSIEKKLSVLTGETYSLTKPKELESELEEKQIESVDNCSTERGTRRKSCSEENETESPEAKKTKVEQIDQGVGSTDNKNRDKNSEEEFKSTVNKSETSNGIVDGIQSSNSSSMSKKSTDSSQDTSKSVKKYEQEEDAKNQLTEKDNVSCGQEELNGDMENLSCKLLTENKSDETKSRKKKNERKLSRASTESENSKLSNTKEKNCDGNSNDTQNDTGEILSTNKDNNELSTKLKCPIISQEPETERGISDCDKDSQTKTDNPVNAEDSSPSKSISEIEKEEHKNDSIESKKKPTPKKSPRPRKKLFTGGRTKKKSKKPVEEITNPVDSDEEDLNSKLAKLENEEKESKSENKKSKPSLVASRKRRGSQVAKEKESEEEAVSDKKDQDDEEEEVGGKKRKLKGKRTPNKSLRKSIEEKRNGKSSSEEEGQSENNEKKSSKKTPPKKLKAGGKQRKAVSATSSKEKEENNEGSEETSEKKSAKQTGPNSRKYFGIELNVDLMESGRSKRQSSRLAQLKIREQSDSKHVDEAPSQKDKPGKKSKKKREEGEEKQKGSSKKKKIKSKKQSDEDEDFHEEETDKKKGKRRKKKKDPVKAFNQRDPWKWKSSSGSSSENEEEEDHYDIVEEEEELPPTLKSDHEFSPESDIEEDEEWKPVRHARTAQKREPKIETEGEKKDYDDFACEKCGKKDHPEWILLCDTCDQGWHASCLRPSLMLVPEGDWHCPPCQHTSLVKKLQETLRIYDRDTKKRENEELRKKRLAYVGISLDNVLPANQHPRERERDKESGSESSESSGSSESESEDSDEPVYQLRQRRQGTTSYRFNEYDDLINSAIQDEVGIINPSVGTGAAPAGPAVTQTQGGDEQKPEIGAETNGTVVDKEVPPTVSKPVKAEKPPKKEKTESGDESSSDGEDESEEEEEEEEFPSVVPKRNNVLPRPGKRKPRKLNSLDDPSDDDDDDEDFKGSSSEEEEEEEDGSDVSDDSVIGRRGRSKRGHRGPVRRSSRARKSRFDKEFINDDSEDSDGPRRKKKKKVWTESDSESDDSTWGRRKKKKGFSSSNRKKSQKNKKFVIDDELSESEANKVNKQKRQRKIKYGGLDDLEVEDLPSRRTRGRAINYQEVIGSESEEEILNTRKKKVIIEDDDEFVAEKEEEKEDSEGESDDDDDEEDEDDVKDKSSEDEKDNKNQVDKKPSVKDLKEPKPVIPETKPIITEQKPVKPEQKPIILDKKGEITPIKLPPKPVSLLETSPLKTSPHLNSITKEKPKRGRPPKAMIAPPPERLITEDDQYKAIVSKVATLGHTENLAVKHMNLGQPKPFSDPVTPIKIQNSSFDAKLINRSPPIKIRSGVPVNASGRRSPAMLSPTNESTYFSAKSPPMGPSDGLSIQRKPMRSDLSQPIPGRKSINSPMGISVKSENVIEDEDDLDDEDLMDDIEEDEDDEEYSDDEVLEEGEIPKKVARRMERMEQKMEEKRLERLKMKVQPGQNIGSNNPNAVAESKPPTTQPTQPLLRVVSPLKLMANPPGPMQTSFMNPGLNPRIGSPPLARMGIRPPQPPGPMMPVAGLEDGGKRRGRGRGKKQPGQDNPEADIVAPGSSVIQGMLQQQPPGHFPPQRYPPPHPRIPFSPQRMLRPPFHPPHHPSSVKQEPVSHPPPPPPHTTAPPFHPSHRYDPRQPQPNYGPAKPAQYFPPPVHYGNYPPPQPPPPPPPMAPREEPPQTYPVQQQYNEQYPEEASAAPPTTSTSKDEEGSGGEFGGLVSYFSSQREDDIDT